MPEKSLNMSYAWKISEYVTASIYFRVNLKIEKPTLCCYFTWIVFIKLDFTVVFMLIRRTYQFVGKENVWFWEMGGGGGGGGPWGDPRNEGVDTTLRLWSNWFSV